LALPARQGGRIEARRPLAGNQGHGSAESQCFRPLAKRGRFGEVGGRTFSAVAGTARNDCGGPLAPSGMVRRGRRTTLPEVGGSSWPTCAAAGSSGWKYSTRQIAIRSAAPALVLTPTAEIRPDGNVTLVAITGSTNATPAEAQVELPWHPQGRTATQLTKPSVAVCTWVFTRPVSSIQAYGGIVPDRQMLQILEKINALGPLGGIL
jgi:mRNA-degrading endonuclease toxin of MazEF toxin-antitoxin module